MLRSAWIALLLLAMSGCMQATDGDGSSSEAEMRSPKTGACRALTPDDITRPTNATPAVDCAQDHTAETFAVGSFPDEVATDDPDDAAHGSYVYDRCQRGFQSFLGGDASLVLRSTMTWAWFRPTDDAWADGARWYRCDVVGGGEDSRAFLNLPKTSRGLLLGRPDDRWQVCANGPRVSGSVKVPCSDEHSWRAVTAVVLGEPGDHYPGDRLVESRTRDFCSRSVGAWSNYPVDYDYGYTWFHEAEWDAGNRRSVCWARTTK